MYQFMKPMKKLKALIRKFLRRRSLANVCGAEEFMPESFASRTYINSNGKLMHTTNIRRGNTVVKGEIIALDEWPEEIKEQEAIPKKLTVIDYYIIYH